MTRTPSPEREAEWERTLAQLDALWSVLAPKLPASVAAMSVAEEAKRARSKVGFSAALAGNRQGLNDLLEIFQYASKEDVEAVNRRLAEVGSPPLHAHLATRAKTVRRILKQKQINTETEYYVLKEFVVNNESPLSDVERTLAEAMLERYERAAGGAA